jgi:hypothetical protein
MYPIPKRFCCALYLELHLLYLIPEAVSDVSYIYLEPRLLYSIPEAVSAVSYTWS